MPSRNHPNFDALDREGRTWQIKGREMFPKGRSFDFRRGPNCDVLLGAFYRMIAGAPRPVLAYQFPREEVELLVTWTQDARLRFQLDSFREYARFCCYRNPESEEDFD